MNKQNYVGSAKGGSSGQVLVDAQRLGAIAYKDNTFAVIAKDLAGNNVTIRTSLNWEELF